MTRLAPMAKLFATRMLRDLTATAQQIYGGNGFTLEYDVQLYFRRAKALQISWWPTRDLEELIAADVLDAPPAACSEAPPLRHAAVVDPPQRGRERTPSASVRRPDAWR